MSPTQNSPFSATLAGSILLCACFGAAPPPAFGQAANSYTRIAFIQASPQTPYGDIYTMDPDGSNVVQLTTLGTNNQAGPENWSADGRYIAFNEFPNFGPGQLWLMNSDGSNQHLLLAEAAYSDVFPGFSPDGEWVIFQRCPVVYNGDNCALYRIRTDGSALTAVTHFQLQVGDFTPVYSPDGTAIAFFSYTRGGVIGAVYVADLSGSEIHRVTPTALGGFFPQWSPDSEKITFISRCCDPQNPDIWAVSRDGSDLFRITGSAASDLQLPTTYQNGNPTWSPDGRAVAFDHTVYSTNSVGIFVVGTVVERLGTPVLIRPNAYEPRWSPMLNPLRTAALKPRQ